MIPCDNTDDSGNTIRFLQIFRSITEIKHTSDRLIRQADGRWLCFDCLQECERRKAQR